MWSLNISYPFFFVVFCFLLEGFLFRILFSMDFFFAAMSSSGNLMLLHFFKKLAISRVLEMHVRAFLKSFIDLIGSFSTWLSCSLSFSYWGHSKSTCFSSSMMGSKNGKALKLTMTSLLGEQYSQILLTTLPDSCFCLYRPVSALYLYELVLNWANRFCSW